MNSCRLIVLAWTLVGVALAAPVSPQAVARAATTLAEHRFATDHGGPHTRLLTHSHTLADTTPLVWQGTTVAYLVSFAPQGFIVLRTDDHLPPCKLYAAGGSFSDLPPDLQAVVLSELAHEQGILAALQRRDSVPDTYRAEWSELLEPVPTGPDAQPPEDSYPPLLETAWNQDMPYNQYAPVAPGGPGDRAYAGCVACAMAQILRFYQYPPQVAGDYAYTDASGACRGTHALSDVGLSPYQWQNMPGSVTVASPGSVRDAIAQLMYHCGVSVNMDFEADGSGAYSADVVDALTLAFYYTSSGQLISSGLTTGQWYQRLIDSLAAGRPVYYGMNAGLYGHAVVCDGARSGNEIHLNFGWGGYGNAWYDLDNVTIGGLTWVKHHAILDIAPVYATNAPQIASLEIAGGAPETVSRAVTLFSAGSNMPMHCMASEDPAFTGARWQVYTNALPFLLTHGSGVKTVYMRVRNAGGTSAAISDTIILSELARPTNDAFEAAWPLAGTTGAAAGMNYNATAQSGEPDHAGQRALRSVWWRWSAPSNMPAVRFVTDGSSIDTLLALYTGTALRDLIPVAENDDRVPGSDFSSAVAVSNVARDTTFFIAVDGYAAETGLIGLSWDGACAAPHDPPNDDFDFAAVLPGYAGAMTCTTATATAETGEPAHAGYPAAHSVWWRWTAPSDVPVLRLDSAASDHATRLVVYHGESLDGLQEWPDLVTNGVRPGAIEAINIPAGARLYLAVDAAHNGGGVVVLSYTSVPEPVMLGWCIAVAVICRCRGGNGILKD